MLVWVEQHNPDWRWCVYPWLLLQLLLEQSSEQSMLRQLRLRLDELYQQPWCVCDSAWWFVRDERPVSARRVLQQCVSRLLRGRCAEQWRGRRGLRYAFRQTVPPSQIHTEQRGTMIDTQTEAYTHIHMLIHTHTQTEGERDKYRETHLSCEDVLRAVLIRVVVRCG